jgi:hypothetical protein
MIATDVNATDLGPSLQLKVDPLACHSSSVVAAGVRPRSRFLSRWLLSLQRDDLGMVDEAVDHGGGHDVVTEDLA